MSSAGDRPGWRGAPRGARKYSKDWRARPDSTGQISRLVQKRVRLVFNLACVAAIGGLIVWLLWPQRNPSVLVVLIGTGTYQSVAFPANTGGGRDIELLKSLHQDQGAQSIAVRSFSDMLTAEGLLKGVGKSLADLKEDNIIIYCNLFGTVREADDGESSGESQWIAIDAGPDCRQSAGVRQLASLRSFLNDLARILGDKNVLLLVDTGRTQPNWRVGILAHDFPTQFAADVKAIQDKLPRLRVLTAAGTGQTSYTSETSRTSTFARLVVDGLRGAADGFGESGPSSNTNHRVECDELYWFVKSGVETWSLANRGRSQTVERAGAADDFTITLAAAHRGSPAKFDDQSADDVSPGNVSENSPKADAGPPAAAPTGGQAGPGESTARKSRSEPAAAEKQLWAQVDKLWTRRDAYTRRKLAVHCAPHVWRMIQSRLLLVEQRILGGESAAARSLLELIDGGPTQTTSVPDRAANAARNSLFAQVDALCDLFEPGAPELDVSVAYLRHGAAAPQSKEVDALVKLIKAAWVETAQVSTAEAKPAEALQQLGARFDARAAGKSLARRTLFTWLWNRVGEIIENDKPEMLSLDLQRIARLAQLAPVDQPAEFHWLGQVLGDVRPAAQGALLRIVRQAYELELLAQESSACDPRAYAEVREDLDRANLQRRAGMQWLLVGGGNAQQAIKAFTEAARLYKRVRHVTDQIARSLSLRDELAAQLPDFARWVAQGDEVGDRPTERKRLIEIFSNPHARDELVQHRRPRDFDALNPTAPERQLLDLCVDLRILNHPATRRELTDAELAEAEIRWSKFKGWFGNEADRLTEDRLATPDRWRELDRILQNPWIDAATRKRLRVERRRIAVDLESRDGLRAPNAATSRDEPVVSGLWQAFWAVQVLGMTIDNAEAERTLWTLWVKLARRSVNDAAAVDLRSRLGRLIGGGWTQLVRDLDVAIKAGTSGAPLSQDAERLLRGLHATDDAPFRPDADPVRSVRRAQLWEVLLGHYRGFGHGDFRRYQPLQAALGQSGTAPPLIELPAYVSFEEIPQGAGAARVALVCKWPGGQPEAGAWLELDFDEAGLEVSVPGSPPLAPGKLAADSASDRPVMLDVKIRPGVQSGQMLIAALQCAGRPPVLAALPLKPKFDDSGWSIVFRGSGGQELVQRQEGRGKTVLKLPPLEEPFKISPLVKRPRRDGAESIAGVLTCKTAAPPFEKTIGAFAAKFVEGEDTAPLQLGMTVPVAPPPVTVPPGGAPPAQTGQDVSLGLTFKFDVMNDGEKVSVRREVGLAAYDGFDLIKVTKPMFDRTRLEFFVETAEGAAGRLPAGDAPLNVKLRLPDDFPEPKQANLIAALIPGGRPVRLFAELDVKDVDESKSYEVALDVMGLGGAFRYACRPNRLVQSSTDAVGLLRVVKPQPNDAFDPTKGGPALKVEVMGQDNRPVTLKYLTATDAARRPSATDAVAAPADAARQTRFTLLDAKEAEWTLRMSSRAFEAPLNVEGTGRFVVYVWLLDDQEKGREMAAVAIPFALDKTPPTVQRFRLEKPRNVNDRPLEMLVEAQDPESGVVALQWTIADARQAADPEKIEDKVWKSAAGLRQISIPPDQFPESLKFQVLVRVKNRAGLAAFGRLMVDLEESAAAKAARLGTLVVNLKSPTDATYNITLTSEKNSYQFKDLKKRDHPFRFPNLPPGQYTVGVQSYSTQGRELRRGPVQIAPRETATIEIDN